MFTLPAVRHVLALGAHCDDIEIGCGGLLQRIAQTHPEAVLTAAIFSGDDVRQAESRECLQDLFPKDRLELRFFRYPDAFFPEHWGAIKRDFQRISQGPAPDLVLTHREGDAHQDHRVLQELTWNAIRGPMVWEYEIPKFEDDLKSPNLFVPLSVDDLERKINALMVRHTSQRGKPWFRDDVFRGLASLRGMHGRSPTGYAEAFWVKKLVVTV